jgi:hypothetical protein
MKRFAVILVALFAFSFCATAQVQTTVPGSERADKIQKKVEELELLNQLLPVLLTKDQLRKMLPVIEEGRKLERDLMKEEIKIMNGLEKTLDTAISDGYKKKKVPNKEIMTEVFTAYRRMANARTALVGMYVGKVLAVVNEELDEGQRKAAAGSIPLSAFGAGVDPEKITDELRLQEWVKRVVLAPAAYPVLLKLYKGS